MTLKAMVKGMMCIALLAAGPALAGDAAQPYKGQAAHPIKSLSPEEVEQYLAGAGMGYAKAAELNRYPGPMHALELAEQLGLAPEQRAAMASLMKIHKAEARQLGGEVVRLERELDALFAERRATPDMVDAKLAELAVAQARYRGSHLKTHIEATKLLTSEQIAKYDVLRGYAGERPQESHQRRRHAH